MPINHAPLTPWLPREEWPDVRDLGWVPHPDHGPHIPSYSLDLAHPDHVTEDGEHVEHDSWLTPEHHHRGLPVGETKLPTRAPHVPHSGPCAEKDLGWVLAPEWEQYWPEDFRKIYAAWRDPQTGEYHAIPRGETRLHY